MHNPRNKEILHAITWLKGNGHIKNQAEATKAIGKSRGLLTNILNNREAASDEVCKLIDEKLLAKHGESLAKFKKPRPIAKVLAEEEATEMELLISRVQYLEFQNEEILEMCASILARVSGQKNSKLIRKMADDKVRAKAEAIRAAQGGKQVS